RGETDLKKETQRLNVSVQPELSSSAALGVAVINPLAGMAALLANKFLQNPLNKMFSFEYLVTGKWDDPKVERITATPTPAPPANSTQ
ncbi:MAG TPA: AsmA-like C-terminal region-containing protein, partial [Accumulibacter sp.]|nr:AsmA-like C-terminal region-containing protein [Accumulibacter sp.]